MVAISQNSDNNSSFFIHDKLSKPVEVNFEQEGNIVILPYIDKDLIIGELNKIFWYTPNKRVFKNITLMPAKGALFGSL